MKQIILVLSLVFILRPVFPVLDYLVNYEYIKTELCVNRKMPSKGCNGKCYLAKQLAKAAASQKSDPSDKKHFSLERTDLFVYLGETIEFEFFGFRQTPHFRIKTLFSDESFRSVFRPPVSIS